MMMRLRHPIFNSSLQSHFSMRFHSCSRIWYHAASYWLSIYEHREKCYPFFYWKTEPFIPIHDIPTSGHFKLKWHFGKQQFPYRKICAIFWMLSNQIVGKPISHLRIYAEPLANTLISLIICACLKKLNGIPQEKIKEYFGFSNKKCLKYTYCTSLLQHDINI